VVRELSKESVHAIDRLTSLLVDAHSSNVSVEQWDADTVHDTAAAKRVLMNSSSVRVVPGSEGSYARRLTATDDYHFAFPSVSDGEDRTVETCATYPAPPANYADAVACADADQWRAAMQAELSGHTDRPEPTWRR
jgi:hypothetical protein